MEKGLSERSLAGSETAIRQPLPNLIPQKTNVLTGASTKYYQNNVSAWNNTYEGLVKYQANKVNDSPVRKITAQDFEKSKAVTQDEAKVSFPLRGQPLYIGERNREANLRNEIMQQLNDHTKMIHQVQMQVMIDEEEKLLKNAEQEVERQIFSMSTLGETTSTLNSQRRAATTKRQRPGTKEVLSQKTYDVYSSMLPHSAQPQNTGMNSTRQKRYGSVQRPYQTRRFENSLAEDKSVNLPSLGMPSSVAETHRDQSSIINITAEVPFREKR